MTKPTGTHGFFRATVGEDDKIVGEFIKTELSPEQAAIEPRMAEQFISSANTHFGSAGETFCLSDPQANAEDDYDLTVLSPNGLAYLELMEIAPLDGPLGR